VGSSGALDVGRNDSYTLSAWVKTTDSGSAIVSKMDPGDGYRGYDLYVRGDGRLRAHLIHDFDASPKDAIVVRGSCG